MTKKSSATATQLFYKGGMQLALRLHCGANSGFPPTACYRRISQLRQRHHLFVSIFQRTVSFLTMQSYYTGAQPICAAEKYFQNIFQIFDNLLFANENFLDFFLILSFFDFFDAIF